MVDVYSKLKGFPQSEQPRYYEMLANMGHFAEKKDVKVLVASIEGELAGGVVYFGDMAEYGSGGSATNEKNTSGVRFLAVDESFRNTGVGKALTLFCIDLARNQKHSQLILHTTQAMQIAWNLYEKLGFKRSKDLDFLQEQLPVFGFRLHLS
ncbi:MAG: GNAT family N-acetyltransferase [Burkholderiaceae bacterium]|nr:GNAT family N-acetyltransferase [Burkholderiaceae bacterium]